MPEGESEHLKKYGITPKEIAGQDKTTGRLIEGGAEYTDDGRLEVTIDQAQRAELEMKGEQIAKNEIFSFPELTELIRLVSVEKERSRKEAESPTIEQRIIESRLIHKQDLERVLGIMQSAENYLDKQSRGEK